MLFLQPLHAICGDGGSSNGRTADSGSAYRGSNPCPPAIPPLKFEFREIILMYLACVGFALTHEGLGIKANVVILRVFNLPSSQIAMFY
jgi:hypothetical protein